MTIHSYKFNDNALQSRPCVKKKVFNLGIQFVLKTPNLVENPLGDQFRSFSYYVFENNFTLNHIE